MTRPRLSPTAAFYLQASIVVSFLAASAAPTPLYPVYQSAWGLSPITITAIFGVYAVAVLTALLVVGSLSDHVGRRPVLLAALGLQALAMLIFAAATGLEMLVVARVVQGLSAGAALGAVGAGMLDIDRAKGTLANAIGPMMGTGTGGLLSGLLVQFLPAPTTLVYLVLFVVLAAQALGVASMPESSDRKPGALASLRPHFALPPAVRSPMLRATPALIAAWALAGFYASLGPMLVRRLGHSTSLALGGLTLVVFASAGVLAVFTTRARAGHTVTALGTAALAAGVALSLAAIVSESLAGFFAGTFVAGLGFGASFQGAIRSVVSYAAPHERAGVLSLLYVISYLAFGVPAVAGGALLVYGGGGVMGVAHVYGLAVITLAALAFLGALARRPSAGSAVAVTAR